MLRDIVSNLIERSLRLPHLACSDIQKLRTMKHDIRNLNGKSTMRKYNYTNSKGVSCEGWQQAVETLEHIPSTCFRSADNGVTDLNVS